MTDPMKDAEIIIEAKKNFPTKPIICAFLGGEYTKKSIEVLSSNDLSVFNNLSNAVKVMARLIEREDIHKRM